MDEDQLVVVFCTAPTEDVADELARGLVESALAACVQVVPRIRSHYVWERALESTSEAQLVIKTRVGCLLEAQRWLEMHHPYDVPEFVAIPVVQVSGPYGQWVLDQTRQTPQ